MPSVRVRENEYFDAALRRFKRACEKAGVLTELRRREFYEKPTQERKRKKAAAVKRHLKRLSRENMRGAGGAPASPPRGGAGPALLLRSRPPKDVSQRAHYRRHEGGDALRREGAPRRHSHDHVRHQAARGRRANHARRRSGIERSREDDQTAQGIAGAVPSRQSSGSGRQGIRRDHPSAGLPALAVERCRNRRV